MDDPKLLHLFDLEGMTVSKSGSLDTSLISELAW